MSIQPQEPVVITREEYESLLDDRELLDCLRAVGVDNWDGWDAAMDLYMTPLEEEDTDDSNE